MQLKFKRLVTEAKLPCYAHVGDSGMDIRSVEEVTVPSGEHRVVRTGLAAEIPDGYEIQVRPRSGMASKQGVQCSWGTVDSNYRGEIGVNLFNFGREPYVVRVGDRVAQLVVSPVVRVDIGETDELGDTNRGTDGFGSTGRA